MPCERCVNRRDFLATAAGAAGLVAISGCGDGEYTGIAAVVIPRDLPLPQDEGVVVANFSGLATDGFLVKVASFYAAKRTGPASFEAYSMACTHEGCLTEIVNGARFECPCHGSRFDNNGAVIEGPATRPLQILPTSYDPATDTLTIN
jgi:Rieske Fe-S protein